MLNISVTLNELELLKKLEKSFNDSKKYEIYLLYYVINNNNLNEYSNTINSV